MVQSQDENGSKWTKTVKNRIFGGILVVRPPASGVAEAGALIKFAGSSVRLANLKKHSVSVCFAGAVEEGLEKLSADASPSSARRHHDVFEFPLGSKMVGNEESGDVTFFGAFRRRRVFGYQE